MHARCHAAVVGDDDERRAGGVAKLGEKRQHAVRALPIEIARRLVRQHDGRRCGERARHRHALPFATGELVGSMIRSFGEVYLGEQFPRPRRGGREPRAADQERHGDVLQRGKLRQQVVKLVHEAHALVAQSGAAGRPRLRERLPRHGDGAAVRIGQARQNVQQRALAGAGAANDANALARRHRQVHAPQHRQLATGLRVRLGHAARLEWHGRVAGVATGVLTHGRAPAPAAAAPPATPGRPSPPNTTPRRWR